MSILPRTAAAMSSIWRTAALCAILMLTVGCGGESASSQKPEEEPENQTANRDAVSIVISGDTAGWIVPCGCTSNQSGGLLRRGTIVTELAEQGKTVVADAGGAASGTAPYQRAKFEAILQGELAMGLAAHNLGHSEVELGPEYLHSNAKKWQVPFVSANARDKQGELVAQSHRLVTAGGVRLAFIGVLSPQYATEEIQIDPPQAAILSVVDSLSGQYDYLIVLAYLPEAELRSLAESLPEADAVVGGPTGQSIAPQRIGNRLLTSATKKGKFVAHLKKPAAVNEPWSGEVIEVSQKFHDDSSQRQNLKAFYDFLLERDFAAEETGLVPPLPAGIPAEYRIAGSESCRACHQQDCQLWEQSAHSHAWETLVKQQSQMDSDCQRCHTTGFGLPGGFVSIGRSLNRVNVGCESCHGPSQAHVQNPGSAHTPFVARDHCLSCHDPENSPHFDDESYWEMILHGTSLATPSGAASAPETTETKQ